jgi:DNA ligase 1
MSKKNHKRFILRNRKSECSDRNLDRMLQMLNPGETTEVKGSAAKPYVVKNVDGVVWSCTCMGWKNSPGQVDQKICKHVRSIRGSASATPVAKSTFEKLKGSKSPPPVLLAHSYEDFDDLDPTGWLWSEKLDGVRAYWDGEKFISRQGNVYFAPDWFREGLPSHPLDGELWLGRKLFQKTISAVKRQDGGDAWKDVKYVVFDAPHLDTPFEQRLTFLKEVCEKSSSKFMKLHDHDVVESRDHLVELLREHEALGAEGLMIRKPGSKYEIGRSSTLLKVKPFKDAEAEVVGHKVSTKGQFKGLIASLTMRMPSGVEFDLNAGTVERRRNPPPIGTVITYRYTELTDDGKPKCTSFVAVRDYE